jgi:hypothetical protein
MIPKSLSTTTPWTTPKLPHIKTQLAPLPPLASTSTLAATVSRLLLVKLVKYLPPFPKPQVLPAGGTNATFLTLPSPRFPTSKMLKVLPGPGLSMNPSSKLKLASPPHSYIALLFPVALNNGAVLLTLTKLFKLVPSALVISTTLSHTLPPTQPALTPLDLTHTSLFNLIALPPTICPLQSTS